MLQISKADYDLIRWEAERTYPRESCGILLGNVEGERRRVTLTITCQNMPPDATSGRYRIDPETVNAALKLAHSRAETIIGFYHSHLIGLRDTRGLISTRPTGSIVRTSSPP